MVLLGIIRGRPLEAIVVPLAREKCFRFVRFRFDRPLGYSLYQNQPFAKHCTNSKGLINLFFCFALL